MQVTARNVSFATIDCVSEVMSHGSDVTVRGELTRELVHHVTTLERPLERFLFVPKRQNNPFGQIAEAVWVLAGRNDVEWLSRYLPRADDFSDDGSSWRAGYGPRLRRWHDSVDQLDEVRKILLDDGSSRRAVMTLFDPDADFVQSRDVPCNNWLSWIRRDGMLHLAVALRSNDAIWGFSGANAFEWSLIHDAMATWTGAEVGQQTYFATSFHVYDRHWNRAEDMLAAYHRRTPYDFGIKPTRFSTPWGELDRTLDDWFTSEERIRADPDAPICFDAADPFLIACLAAFRIHWGSASWTPDRTRAELDALPSTDVSAACREFLARSQPSLLNYGRSTLSEYLAACDTKLRPDRSDLKLAIKRLHARKDRSYGAAWKRRGEIVSVLPNIARKVDRLEVYAREGDVGGDEAVLDTAVDLYVYVVKYRLLIAERGLGADLLPADAPTPFSDHESNFNILVDAEDFTPDDADVAGPIRASIDIFDRLWRSASDPARAVEVLRLVDDLRLAARDLIAAVAERDPMAVSKLVAEETRT